MRTRLAVAWSVLLVAVCLAWLVLQTYANERNFIAESRRRIQTAATLGSLLIDRDALERLANLTSASLEPSAVTAIEHSADYRRVSRQLNDIRNTDTALIRFVYVLQPRGDSDPRFLADADVLSTHPPPPDQISHFNSTYSPDELAMLRDALRTCEPQVERDFYEDETYHVRSLSAYAPIRSRSGRCLGVLGVDMPDTSARELINGENELTHTSIFIIAAVALALGLIVVLLLSRPWIRMRNELAHLAFPYRTEPVITPDILQVANDVAVLKKLSSTPTDSIARRVQDEVAAAYSGPTTSQRIQLDVVPDCGEEPDPDRVDHVTVHERSLVLLGTFSGFRRDATTSTSTVLGAWRRLLEEIKELVDVRNLHHAPTLGGGSYIVLSLAAPDGRLARALIEVAQEITQATKRCASATHVPMAISFGVSIGRLVSRMTRSGKLVDAWGAAFMQARQLQELSPEGRIHIAANVRALITDLACRRRLVASTDEPETYFIEPRSSLQLMGVTEDASQVGSK